MRFFPGLAVAASLCSGCALTTSHIDVPYQPIAASRPIPDASASAVAVSAVDDRTTYRDRVGTKKNGYGMEMAAIVPDNDIPDTVRDAFRQELGARGFRIGDGPGTVQVEVVRFYNDFKPGFFSGDAVATVAFNVKVSSPAHPGAFSKYYEGTGTEPNIQIMGADNTRAALVKAFQSAVGSAVNDPDLIQAVLHAGQASTEPRPGT